MTPVYKPVGFFRAFFHLMAGMFLAIFVPLIGILNGLGRSPSIPDARFWSLEFPEFLIMVGTGVGLLATAFGAARWKVYVRRMAYVFFAAMVILAATTR